MDNMSICWFNFPLCKFINTTHIQLLPRCLSFTDKVCTLVVHQTCSSLAAVNLLGPNQLLLYGIYVSLLC